MDLRFLLGRYKYNSDASGIPPTPRDAIRPAGILPSRAPLHGQIADAQGVLGSWLARRGRGAAGEPPPPQARNRRVRSLSALNPPAAVRCWNRLPILLIKERHGRGKHTKCPPFAQSLPVLDTGTRLSSGHKAGSPTAIAYRGTHGAFEVERVIRCFSAPKDISSTTVLSGWPFCMSCKTHSVFSISTG